MDTRRLLMLSAAAGLASGCAGLTADEASRAVSAVDSKIVSPVVAGPPAAREEPSLTIRPYLEPAAPPEAAAMTAVAVAPEAAQVGRDAIAAANVAARAASRSDQFVGGVQVFAWAPGRIYEVWSAPLRVTTLTLAPGETVQSKAAGDTVRWQIGETTSGTGAEARTHILLKPLERGLETNLVLTTSHRVYLLSLKSGPAEAFNAAVAWDAPDSGRAMTTATTPAVVETAAARPQGPLDARYRIRPDGRAPRWTPTAVFNDGVRTFITFPPGVWTDEAPALFIVAADGQAQLVNYRQEAGLFVVDRIFDEAELRLGAVRPRTVRLQRLAGDRP